MTKTIHITNNGTPIYVGNNNTLISTAHMNTIISSDLNFGWKTDNVYPTLGDIVSLFNMEVKTCETTIVAGEYITLYVFGVDKNKVDNILELVLEPLRGSIKNINCNWSEGTTTVSIELVMTHDFYCKILPEIILAEAAEKHLLK